MGNEETVKEHIQLVRELSNEMAAYLYSLSDNIWRSPEDYASACEDWKIADVITHLIMNANMLYQGVEGALEGNTSTPMGFNRPTDPVERLHQLVELRNAYHEDIFYEFNSSARRFNLLLTSLEPESYELPAWHPRAVFTVERLIAFRVQELALHSWDIRYPMDRDSKLSERAVPFLAGWVPYWLRAGFQPSESLNSPVRYRFDLGDGKGYDVVYSGDDFRVTPIEEKSADVTFNCDIDTYILFCTGRLPFRRSVRRGRLFFEGDEQLAESFTNRFRPI